jgi:hypothetical protein
MLGDVRARAGQVPACPCRMYVEPLVISDEAKAAEQPSTRPFNAMRRHCVEATRFLSWLVSHKLQIAYHSVPTASFGFHSDLYTDMRLIQNVISSSDCIQLNGRDITDKSIAWGETVLSHYSVGLQGLYQGSLYFFCFFYAVFIGCNMSFTVCVALWAGLFCFVVCCLFLVVLFCVICVFECMWRVYCVYDLSMCVQYCPSDTETG